jgi:centromeric protein E
MNADSSRSHSIFRVTVESRQVSEEASGVGAVRVATLNLVDLAGSERAAHTKATGLRLKEGGAINRSLLYLSEVIHKLSERQYATWNCNPHAGF